MTPETGKPIYDGRYVVYVPGILGEWLQPTLAMWTGGAWHFLNSSEKFPDEVKTWIGPLPVLRTDWQPEYDL